MRTPPPVAKTLEEANEIIARQHARIEELEERLAALEARLGQNSTNAKRL